VGYLTATARVDDRVDSAARRASAWVAVTTGPRIRLGTVRVEARGVDDGDPRFDADRVRRLTGFEPGRVLGSQELLEARRRLDNAGLFDEIRIALDSVRGADDGDTTSDATVDVSVSTVEGLANQVRLRAGYATLDCYRLQLQGRRSGVLRPSGSIELTMNLSKIAVGSPLDFAPGMCSSAVREDPYSTRLNYYVGGTYAVAGLGRRGVTRSLSIYAERRSEYLAYLRTTYIGGSASFARSLARRWGATLAYDLSYSRTEAEPAVLCATFSACLPADREHFTEALPFGLLSLVASYDGTDVPADPTRGRSLRAEFRIAPWWLGTAAREQVFGGRLSASAYMPLSKRTVLAARVTGGFVNSLPGGDFIPQGERLFAGGASTVRGFRQNEIGSSVYIVDSVRTVIQGADTLLWAFPPDSNESRAVPTGGNTAVVGNLEIRVRPPVFTELVQFVAFVDAGVVWNRGEESISETQVVFTPGVGARLSTFIGPIRLDIASNRYAPPKGPAYRDVSLGYDTAPLYCVSIGNTLPVTGFGQTDPQGRPIPPVQAEGPCPATFAPTRATGFWDRLTINFSIGHAF
jgi:outer membrane protein assembly factor BamA